MTYNRTLFSHGFKVSPSQDKKDHLNYTYFVRAPQFRVIVFKGGGGRVWVYKKFLHMLEKNGLIDEVKEYGGSSAGALFAVLAAMPLKHKERERIIDEMKFHRDILDDSFGSKIYKFITSPLYLISTPLSWIARAFEFAAGFLGFPMSIISSVVKFVSIITHPECAAGIYNLITRGGIYRGKALQEYIKKSLHKGTKLSLERFLNNIDNPIAQENMIYKFLRMHDLVLDIEKDLITHKITVLLATEDITFEHFHRLASIKGLGFKDVFLTATRCQETSKGRLRIFNYKTSPQKPLHLAVRMSMSAPFIYQTVYDEGAYYMDGGCANNFPIQYASRRRYANDFERMYLTGIYEQDLDVLGVRVEYAKDLDFFHHPIHSISSWWEKVKTRMQEKTYNMMCGMDIFTPENNVRHIIKEQYPLRVLQLYDHGVGFTELAIDATRKHKILQREEKRIQAFLNAHYSELSHVENYTSLSRRKLNDANTMNLKRQKKFLRFLHKESIPNETIFSSDFSDDETVFYRKQLIQKLTDNLKGLRRGI